MGTESGGFLRRFGRGRWPAGFLGMLALAAAVELAAARGREAFGTARSFEWGESGRLVGRAATCSVVAFGDSLVKHGVVGPALERALGPGAGRAYNLAVSGGQAPGHYFLLRRMLARGARPAALIVDGEMLPERPQKLGRLWPEMLTPRECAELAWEADDADFAAEVVLGTLLPSYRSRREIGVFVRAALAGKPTDAAMAIPVYIRNARRNGGAAVLPPRDDPPGVDDRPAALEREAYRPDSYACDPLNDRYIRRFLDLAAARGVPVFWVLPPYHPEVAARRERFGHLMRYREYLHILRARHANLVVVDAVRSGYPAEALADMTHLNRLGALAFSDALGALVRDHLAHPEGSPRWRDLPPYDPAAARALAASSPVEDIRQSAAGLSTADPVRNGTIRR